MVMKRGDIFTRTWYFLVFAYLQSPLRVDKTPLKITIWLVV